MKAGQAATAQLHSALVGVFVCGVLWGEASTHCACVVRRVVFIVGGWWCEIR